MKRHHDREHSTRSYSLFDTLFDNREAVAQPTSFPLFVIKDDRPYKTAYYWPFDLQTGEESDIHRDMRLWDRTI